MPLVRNEKQLQFNLPKNYEESHYIKRFPYVGDKELQFDNSIINDIQISNLFEKIKKKKRNRIKPNRVIKNAAENMNKTVSAKYGIALENIEQKRFGSKRLKIFSRSLQFYETNKNSK